MKKLVFILFISISISGLSQPDPNPQNPWLESITYTNPYSAKYLMLEKIINQNNQIIQQTNQFTDIIGQIVESDHILNMKLPGKLMQLHIYNAYIGELAGTRMDSMAKWNIIICDTCTGAGLSDEFNIVIDYDSDWVNLNMVEWEITELYIADDALETYKDSPYYIRKCILNSALKMIHRGIARENNLLPGYGN